jgi:hypothetical protein
MYIMYEYSMGITLLVHVVTSLPAAGQCSAVRIPANSSSYAHVLILEQHHTLLHTEILNMHYAHLYMDWYYSLSFSIYSSI